MVRSVKPSVSLRDWRVSCVLCFINTEDTGLNIVFVRRENTEDRPVTIPRTNVGIFKQSSIVLLMMSQYSYIGTPVLLYWYCSTLISVLESSYYEDWACYRKFCLLLRIYVFSLIRTLTPNV